MSKAVWSTRAKRSQAQIARFFARRDPPAALLIGGKIIDAGESLGRYLTGRPSGYPGWFEKSVSGFNYILYYQVERHGGEDVVTNYDIVHTRRDWVPGHLPTKR